MSCCLPLLQPHLQRFQETRTVACTCTCACACDCGCSGMAAHVQLCPSGLCPKPVRVTASAKNGLPKAWQFPSVRPSVTQIRVAASSHTCSFPRKPTHSVACTCACDGELAGMAAHGRPCLRGLCLSVLPMIPRLSGILCLPQSTATHLLLLPKRFRSRPHYCLHMHPHMNDIMACPETPHRDSHAREGCCHLFRQ